MPIKRAYRKRQRHLGTPSDTGVGWLWADGRVCEEHPKEVGLTRWQVKAKKKKIVS